MLIFVDFAPSISLLPKMKCIFLNIAYPKEIYKQLAKDSKGILQTPSDVFQWAVIDGLEQCGVDYMLACVPALPAWPRCRHLITPKGEMTVKGKVRGHYLSYFNVPAFKQISQQQVLKKYIRQWCQNNETEDQLVALTYTQHVEILGAAIKMKKYFPNLIVVPIITDLVENALDFKSNHSLLKRLQMKLEAKGERALFSKVDKFVLLTRQMTEHIPEALGKHIVVEGIAPYNNDGYQEVNKKDSPRTLLYTGVLEEYAGVRLLIDAFMRTKSDDFRLIICGSGSDADYVRNASERDSRIEYRGKVEREVAVRLQHESTLLINPRQSNGGITKYSFPSKTMEYMTSGTPMIGYHLEGIPDEYYEYMVTPSDLSIEALAAKIEEALQIPIPQLEEMAKKAKNFICDKKSSKCQVQRILDFISI